VPRWRTAKNEPVGFPRPHGGHLPFSPNRACRHRRSPSLAGFNQTINALVGNIYFDTTADIDPAYINVRAEVPAAAASPGGMLFGRLHSTSN
jgi:hypothetical protein